VAAVEGRGEKKKGRKTKRWDIPSQCRGKKKEDPELVKAAVPSGEGVGRKKHRGVVGEKERGEKVRPTNFLSSILPKKKSRAAGFLLRARKWG